MRELLPAVRFSVVGSQLGGEGRLHNVGLSPIKRYVLFFQLSRREYVHTHKSRTSTPDSLREETFIQLHAVAYHIYIFIHPITFIVNWLSIRDDTVQASAGHYPWCFYLG